MKIASARQMQAIDQTAQEQYGIPGIILMEHAALELCQAAGFMLGGLPKKKVMIFCGKGNNGGDGLAMARLVRDAGGTATAVLLFPEAQYSGLALINLVMARKFGVAIRDWNEIKDSDLVRQDLLVDAMLGTGSAGAPRGSIGEAIHFMNDAGIPILAADLPSGVEPDTGQISGRAIRAAVTVTFGLPQPGLLCYPGAEHVGKLQVGPIGFPAALLDNPELKMNYLTPGEVLTYLPRRGMTAHKGSTGHATVLGGSAGMTGAVAMAALGALRSGCGLVTAGLRPDGAFPEKPMEVMVKSWNQVAGSWNQFDSIIFGPGLNQAPDGLVLLTEMLNKAGIPMVIDADGLNHLAQNHALLGKLNPNIVLTPHPGEMARLTGLSVASIQADRLGIAEKYAASWNAVVVLKGARTVIAAPNGEIFINMTGNPGMATAGMGDVLAGVIGGLMAQGAAPFEAAVAGAYLHGLAGDLAVSRRGRYGILAGDVIEMIPETYEVLQNGTLPSFPRKASPGLGGD